MATTTKNEVAGGLSWSDWLAGAVGGIGGGILFGAILWAVKAKALTKAIPALFQLHGLIAGWFVHLCFSLVFGLVFVFIIEAIGWGNSIVLSTGLGLTFGAVLWFTDTVIIMPFWLQAVGFPKAPSFPHFGWLQLWVHLAFGLVLGVVYPFIASN